MGNQISYNKDDLKEVTFTHPKDPYLNRTYYVTKKTCTENADCVSNTCIKNEGEETGICNDNLEEKDYKCIKTVYEGKDVVACKLKEGAFYDSIESILEDKAYTENNQLAAAKACSTGLVWKNRNPYVASYPHIADKTDKASVKLVLGKRLKEVIKRVRGDYNRGASSEMNIQTIGTHQNSCNMLNDVSPCRSNYAKLLYNAGGDINIQMITGKMATERNKAILENNISRAELAKSINVGLYNTCMANKLVGMEEPSFYAIHEMDALDCQTGPFPGFLKNYIKEKVFKIDAAKDIKEFWDDLSDVRKADYRQKIKVAQKMLCATFKDKCWLRGQDDLIKYQQLNPDGIYNSKEAKETPQLKRDIVYVYPYEYDQSNKVEKNFCPTCNLESIVGKGNEELLEEARQKEILLKEQRLSLTANVQSQQDSSAEFARIQAEQQKAFDEKMKAMEDTMNSNKTKTIVTPAANPLNDLFNKHKNIIMIGGAVFLLLFLLLLLL